jgi:signal transduction histidine kinase
VKGFNQRSGIQVNVNCTPEQERMPVRVEIALFRILQEALSNAYRHAHTSVVDVYLEQKNDRVTLVVHDHGHGIPPEELHRLQKTTIGGGVGISSMRERIHELHGVFEIQSDSSGTVISAEIPLSQRLLRASRNGKL